MNLASSSFLLKAQSHTKQLSWIHIFFYTTLKLQNLIPLKQILERNAHNWKHLPWVPTIDSIIHVIYLDIAYQLSALCSADYRMWYEHTNCKCALWIALRQREHNWYWRSRILMSSCPVHIKQGSTSIKPFTFFFSPRKGYSRIFFTFWEQRNYKMSSSLTSSVLGNSNSTSI